MTGTSDTTTHFGSPMGESSPAVVNVRRPRSEPIEAELVLQAARSAALEDSGLPPTVLRLPNLATLASLRSGVSVLSVLHWIGLALGALVALWLIFGGRGGPKPTGEEMPAAPARAEASQSPAWEPPPLSTAGDTEAPAWKPPAAVATPAPAAPPTAAPEANVAAQPDIAPPASEAATMAPGEAAPAESQDYEPWPKADPESDEPAPQQSAQPDLPGWDNPGALSAAGAADRPVARTAQRDTFDAPVQSDVPDGEAESLGITVSVPQ